MTFLVFVLTAVNCGVAKSLLPVLNVEEVG